MINSIKTFFAFLRKNNKEEEKIDYSNRSESFLLLKNKKDIEKAFANLDIVIADVVELEFKDPRKFGIVSNHTTTFTRFNPGEFEDNNRIVKGIVSRVWKENKPINEWFIEVSTHTKSIKTQKIIERKLLLMASEIEWIRKIA